MGLWLLVSLPASPQITCVGIGDIFNNGKVKFHTVWLTPEFDLVTRPRHETKV